MRKKAEEMRGGETIDSEIKNKIVSNAERETTHNNRMWPVSELYLVI